MDTLNAIAARCVGSVAMSDSLFVIVQRSVSAAKLSVTYVQSNWHAL